MDQAEHNASITEIPTNTKHNRIMFEGHSFHFERANKSGKKCWNCHKFGCKVIINLIFL